MTYCNDYGDEPACLGEADERFTMDYSDVPNGGLIHWCAFCGPRAHAMRQAIEGAFETRPEFAGELREAIDAAEAEQRRNAS